MATGYTKKPSTSQSLAGGHCRRRTAAGVGAAAHRIPPCWEACGSGQEFAVARPEYGWRVGQAAERNHAPPRPRSGPRLCARHPGRGRRRNGRAGCSGHAKRERPVPRSLTCRRKASRRGGTVGATEWHSPANSPQATSTRVTATPSRSRLPYRLARLSVSRSRNGILRITLGEPDDAPKISSVVGRQPAWWGRSSTWCGTHRRATPGRARPGHKNRSGSSCRSEGECLGGDHRPAGVVTPNERTAESWGGRGLVPG